jgi:serine/threonine protein kinase
VSFFGRRAKKRRNRGSHSRSGSMSFAKSPAKSFAERDMLTGVVATPCYRAPEVIMSEGKYTGAMDVWALGCIFGELLQRQSCGAHTPQLTISPLFRFDDDPLLPPPPRLRGDVHKLPRQQKPKTCVRYIAHERRRR